MNKEDLKGYKLKLLKEQESIKKALKEMKANSLSSNGREEISELSMIDNHPADYGTEMFEKERNYALLSNEKNMLAQIETAMKKIDSNTYGKCEVCGIDIQRERLDIKPSATTCIKCENSKPNYMTYRKDRPVEESTLSPYGKHFMTKDSIMDAGGSYSLENSWEAVEKSNIRKNNDEGDSDAEEDDEDDYGIVEFTDRISNQYYKNQLP